MIMESMHLLRSCADVLPCFTWRFMARHGSRILHLFGPRLVRTIDSRFAKGGEGGGTP